LEKSGSVEEAKIERQKTRALMANIHSLDTAPLVSPDVVSPANPQDSDKTTANDKESDMQRSPEKAPESDVMSGDTDSVPARR
jgi:hypothetical protein